VLANDAKNFAAICLAPISQAPSLADFIAGRGIPQTTVAIALNGSPTGNAPKLGYVGAYDVLSAADFQLCLKHVGDKVEVIGQIVEINLAKTKRSKKPYIFINFGNWRGQIFKVAIWPQAMAVLKTHPDKSWEGKWISVTGLMEPPYSNGKFGYTHLSISITANGQLTLITEVEARRRLAGPGPGAVNARAPVNSNQEALARIKGHSAPARPTAAPAPVPTTPLSPNQAILAKIRASAPQPPTPSAANARPGWPSPPAPTPQRRTPPPSTASEGFFSKLVRLLFK
jgi:hypothetical protein